MCHDAWLAGLLCPCPQAPEAMAKVTPAREWAAQDLMHIFLSTPRVAVLFAAIPSKCRIQAVHSTVHVPLTQNDSAHQMPSLSLIPTHRSSS